MPTGDPSHAGRATIQDVAKLAGVSPMTVSRVVNRSPLVAPATAARVREAMAEVGFRRNQAAANLRLRRSVTMVGLVVDDIANPYYAAVARAVERVAAERGALLVVASFGADPEREPAVVGTLLDRGVDGLILYPAPGDHGYLTGGEFAHRPVVCLGRIPDGLADDVSVDAAVDVIVVDVAGGIRQAVAHLAAHGHRRIGMIAAESVVRRVDAYRAALAELGLPDDPELLRRCPDAAAAGRATRDLLGTAAPPTALVTSNNRMTAGVLTALGSGLAGVALVGFDDFELAEVFQPPVTVVAQDPDELGRAAAELFFARLAGDNRPPQRLTRPMRLVTRGSGELPFSNSEAID